VLDERAEQPAVDLPDDEVGVDHHPSTTHADSFVRKSKLDPLYNVGCNVVKCSR
jgi:hypothetical protein